MQLREFIKEAQVMDPSFRIMQLEGEGGDCINQPEDWPNTNEGVDRFYRHWSRPNNVSGKMKIVTKLSLVQLKLPSGIFLTYLRRRAVHMNYAQLGVFYTVTLGWVAGAHPSCSYRNEMKEIVGKLIKREHNNLQYALFPRSFHFITDKKRRLTTRGIAIKIMKSNNISPAKFREDMVQKWQRIEEDSGNPLGGQYLAMVWSGADLGTNAMTNIFHKQNQFLRTTKVKLVHNLGEIHEVLDIDLNDHVDIPHEYRTIRNILRSFRVKNNQVILMVQKMNTIGTYLFIYHENMEKYMVDILSNIDDHIKDAGDWSACDNHYRFNTGENVTPDDVMRSAGNS
jgi:hypothetical protein